MITGFTTSIGYKRWYTNKKEELQLQKLKMLEARDKLRSQSVLEGHVECSAHSDYDRDQSQKDLDMPRTAADECSSGIPLDKSGKEESRSECGEREKGGKPMSPGTLVLMCNEKDMIFMAFQAAAADPSSSNNQSTSEAYVEQEKDKRREIQIHVLHA